MEKTNMEKTNMEKTNMEKETVNSIAKIIMILIIKCQML